MIRKGIAFAVLASCFMLLVPFAFAQENTSSIEIFIKNESGDRVIPDGLSIKIFKDLETSPIQVISSLENNPIIVSSLPQNHRYKIEVYMNDMYADVGFVDLKKDYDKIEITIKNTGGMRLGIFYSDAETPLSGAKVWIRSQNGKIQSYSETDQSGQTVRTWLYPTVKENDHYYAEILLTPGIKYVYSPIKLQPNIAQDFKIVTKWPVIVDKLITIEVYNTTKNKVTKEDGVFIAQLYDIKKNKIAESQVSDKGLAHFSKLKVNNYALYIKTKDAAGQLKTVAAKKVTITDATETIKVYLNDPELNSDHLNCRCVAFRLDDVQDYYLAPAQIAILSMFKEKNIPLTVGIIGGTIGTDQKLISTIKASHSDNLLELASHSWRHGIYSKMKKSDQEDDLRRTNKRISEVFGITPVTFIPPENLFNNDTISILQANNFTHISYGEKGPLEEPPKFLKSQFYHFPMFAYTAKLDAEKGFWQPTPIEQTLDQINFSIFNYGYAVVMMHPMEFSVYENGYTNKLNTTKIKELDSLIDKLQSDGIKITTINSIQDFDKPVTVKTTVHEQTQPSCNCVAFRLDNVQDFWLNDVQNSVIDTFTQDNIPLTLTVIGKFVGDDPKLTDFIKTTLENNHQIKIASRGWEYVDHTLYDKEKQKSSIKQTNDKIKKVFNKDVTLFSPPYDVFNNDTLDAAKDAGLQYFSSNIAMDPAPFHKDSIIHVPSTLSFTNLIDDDPFYSGTIPQKALSKIQLSIKKYGFAVISFQPSDLALKTDTFKNEVNFEKLALLKDVLAQIKSNQIKIVQLESIPSTMFDNQIVIPDWIKNNAKWWSEGKIDDSDFTKGLQYLIEQDVIKIPPTERSTTTQKIPDWIKNNAKWWSEGKIDDSDFIKGIQYLIKNGIIHVN